MTYARSSLRSKSYQHILLDRLHSFLNLNICTLTATLAPRSARSLTVAKPRPLALSKDSQNQVLQRVNGAMQALTLR